MKKSIKYSLLALALIVVVGGKFFAQKFSDTIKNESTKVTNPSISSTVISKTENVVYRTKTGSKYHRANCQYLKKSKIKITFKQAIVKGLEPCSKCNP